MNKLPRPVGRLALTGPIRIAADVHLAQAVPRTAQAFYDFLAQTRQGTRTLILAGDLFDAWIGDDCALHAPDAWLARALAELRATARTCPLYLMQGNRDFLMGARLAQAVGAQLLAGPIVLDTDAGALLLAHGDEYCTDDLAYQRFRRVVRRPWVQSAFLHLPRGLRAAFARRARQHSRARKGAQAAAIMDVNPAAIRHALQAAGCSVLIHGHTHRPAVHPLTLDGRPAWRYVIPDWEYDHAHPPRGGWIDVEASGIRLQEASS